ncbi:hypothetical protein J2W42_005357 [Rhizobium tibeticum]|nr:hypothetical protein [Rhizobium tibeticum]
MDAGNGDDVVQLATNTTTLRPNPIGAKSHGLRPRAYLL